MKATEITIKAQKNTLLPEIDWNDVAYFVTKFHNKMYGSISSTAAWWIDGVGELTVFEKIEVWERIQNYIDHTSRDRAAENDDMPEWV